MARKRKGPKTKARKSKRTRRPAAKAQAKRRTKRLVKAPKVQRARKPAKKGSAPKRTAKHDTRVKFTKRERKPEDEMKVMSLIARVYRQAADEMRALEQSVADARAAMMRSAADEMTQLATKFEKQ